MKYYLMFDLGTGNSRVSLVDSNGEILGLKSFDNKSFDAAPELWREVRGCVRANDCGHCGRCAALMEKVFR